MMVGVRESGLARLEELRAELAERSDLEEIGARFASRSEGAELSAAARRVLDVDPDGLDDGVLVELAGELERAQRHLDAARCRLLGVLEARGATLEVSGHATGGWLGAEHGLSRVEAGRRVRVATRLRRDLPEVAAALAAGEITFEHARVIADLVNPRVRDLVVVLQPQLLALAEGVRFERWAAQVRDLVAIADEDGGHRPESGGSRLRMVDGPDGVLHLDGRFVGEQAAVVRHTLGSMADRLFHRAERDAEAAPVDLPLPPRAGLLADALVGLCRAGAVATHTGKGPVADVTLVLDASDPTVARTPEGVRLADGTTRLLMCDPAITAVVRDSLGVPLDLGTRVRWASAGQRRAAMVRDGGCVFPGCDVPPGWVELHHVHHAEHGGRTDLENLASLCRAHHGVVHRTGWAMTPTGRHRWRITTPTGTHLHTQRHGRTRAGP